MRVAMLYADDSGCGLYRCFLPGAQAMRLGTDVAFSRRLQAHTDSVGNPVSVPTVNADVLVYQRPLLRSLVDTIPLVKRQGVRVVVELDDDFETVHPQNAAYRLVHPKYSPEMNYTHLRRAVGMADLVTVATKELAARYGPMCDGKVEVVPNFVPQSLLQIGAARMELVADGTPVSDGEVRIGWAGQVASHPLDLQETQGAVASVMNDTGVAFRLIGDPAGVPQALGLHHGVFEATGWVPIESYPEAVATLDVGIVPLADTPFNRAKSWLKGLEMAALGVPFVASPLPEYQRLQEYGIGILAADRKQWRDELRALVVDSEYRAEVAERGRAAVAEYLTIETNGHRWINAWHRATRQLIVGRINGVPHPA